jgi:UDPglucose 6-dehydrogenase
MSPDLRAGLEETSGGEVKKLFFSTDIPAAIAEADIIFFIVINRAKQFGAGAGMAADLQYWEKTARRFSAARNPRRSSSKRAPCLSGRPGHGADSRCGGRTDPHRRLSNPEFLSSNGDRDLERPTGS